MKIALIGYGKMGKTIEQIAIQRGHQIVSIIDINNAEDIYSEAFKSADVAIEFTWYVRGKQFSGRRNSDKAFPNLFLPSLSP